MLKFGIVRLLALLVFGFIAPFALYRLRRRIGLASVLALGLVAGLGYGAFKADNPWSGDGLLNNLALMATSGVALLAYVAISLGAAALVARVAPR